jgi:hypothetical protein
MPPSRDQTPHHDRTLDPSHRHPRPALGRGRAAEWRGRQVRQRSYADDVLAAVERLAGRFDVIPYGELAYGIERFPLLALRAGAWQAGLPGCW